MAQVRQYGGKALHAMRNEVDDDGSHVTFCGLKRGWPMSAPSLSDTWITANGRRFTVAHGKAVTCGQCIRVMGKLPKDNKSAGPR